jgi:hypothetical protein
MSEVYEVRHEFVDKEDDTYFTIVGVFSTRELANAAVARARDEPIFRDVLGEFVIYPRQLDAAGWDSGFFSIEDEPPPRGQQERSA